MPVARYSACDGAMRATVTLIFVFGVVPVAAYNSGIPSIVHTPALQRGHYSVPGIIYDFDVKASANNTPTALYVHP